MSDEKIQFKNNVKKKPLRKRIVDSDESDNDDDNKDIDIRNKVEDMKIIQKLRERPNGVNVIGLALGEKVPPDATSSDLLNIKTGGLVNAHKSSKFKQDDAHETGIGTQFNAETNKRDEDEEMVKYIEEELSKRKKKQNLNNSDDQASDNKSNYCSPEEAALQAVPEHLRQSSTHRSEEMLSNQMLSGIPEVDLGIEAKIKNIEATEEAKLKLLWERHRKKDGPSQFVPTNMAVNFVQHNRFNIDESDVRKAKQEADARKRFDAREQEKGNKRKDGEKATDDYHYERFKKQFRRF
ncbi:hypothetical protein HCN44_007245 [Aphidius gifuensis]|uniref:Telomere length and silencing protein 1 homolog n=1 Tax=Aphidius gifuensis TaxID=684658 RepID=A0A834XL51_APHGI|nr:telomere length and silencing protein 1 homolog [Aphidius gifuensis]KAF7988935.1 hypothetical protein HCN44_007245 [Aphidius gifuensis]